MDESFVKIIGAWIAGIGGMAILAGAGYTWYRALKAMLDSQQHQQVAIFIAGTGFIILLIGFAVRRLPKWVD